jgi:DNA invertase Pin-like site-specific DNA recombinase
MPGPKKKPYIYEIAETTVKWKPPKKGERFMIGYARVSMRDQSNQRQIDALIEHGVSPKDIFQDKQSGKTMNRPAWQAGFRDLQSGDCLVVYSLDRLGRNLGDLIDIEKQLYKKGVKLIVIAQPCDTSTSTGRLLFNIIGTVAQFEREWNLDRTLHGLASARARGRFGGQPSPFSDADIRKALRKGKTAAKAAKILKCAKVTVTRRIKEWEAAEEAAA